MMRFLCFLGGGITARVMPGVLHCFYQVETAATKHIRLLCVIFQEANGPDLFNNGTFWQQEISSD